MKKRGDVLYESDAGDWGRERIKDGGFVFVKCVKAWRVKDNKIVEFEYIILPRSLHYD